MQRIKFMFKHFLREPLWFRLLITTTFMISIVFSSSLFNAYYQSSAKLAAAVFFITFAIKLRRSRWRSAVLYAGAIVCLYLSWQHFTNA